MEGTVEKKTAAPAKPTMKDVARESGVSLATVSKVINRITVREDSRRRVEAAIQKLGYQLNAYARALKTNKTMCIAVVLPSLKHPFFAHLADELTACLMKRGYLCQLMITNYDPEAEQKCFSLVRSNRSDGVIALTYSPKLVLDETIPIVTIDRYFSSNVPCVSSDNYRGGELAAEKLLELGCRRLLFLRISAQVPGETDKRCAGFENMCRQRGAAYETLILRDEETEAPFFRFLEERICGGSLEFDGIFCNSDALAFRVRRFLQEQGVAVPGQVQLIGYDGIADHFTENRVCSTIEQPLKKMAETAVRLLLNPSDASAGINVCLPVRYVPGGTTRDGADQ